MKRTLILIITAALILSLAAACGKSESPVVLSAELTPAPTPEPTAEPTPTSAPLATTEEGPFPGGLDDDGRGPEEADYPDGPEGAPETAQLSSDAQHKANLFLSNFAEQFFGDYDYPNDGFVQMAVDFAHRWCKINSQGSISYETVDGTSWEVITLDRADEVVSRYFPYSLSDWHPDDIHSAYDGFLRDGKLYFPAADGEAHNRVAVADGISDDPTGTHTIWFTIYEIDLEEYWNDGVDPDYYWYTPLQAAEDPALSYVQSGTAVVTDGVWNGEKVYKLLSYETW